MHNYKGDFPKWPLSRKNMKPSTHLILCCMAGWSIIPQKENEAAIYSAYTSVLGFLWAIPHSAAKRIFSKHKLHLCLIHPPCLPVTLLFFMWYSPKPQAWTSRLVWSGSCQQLQSHCVPVTFAIEAAYSTLPYAVPTATTFNCASKLVDIILSFRFYF